MSTVFIVPLLRPLGVMSLAFAIFGELRYATELTHPLLPNVPMATVPGPDWLSLHPASFEDARAEQYDQSPGLGLRDYDECIPQKGQFSDLGLSRVMRPSSPADGPPPKDRGRQRSTSQESSHAWLFMVPSSSL